MIQSSSIAKQFIVLLLIALAAVAYSGDIAERFVIARDFTPVLNTSDFRSVFGGVNGNRVKTDNEGLIREMEFIAFPGTLFEVVEEFPNDGYSILHVKTNDYVYDTELYIDSRFVEDYDNNIPPAERKRELPPGDVILKRIKSLEGYPYMWGGNLATGVKIMLDYYKPSEELDRRESELWTMRGVDCSGLIYEAADGVTPRNTSSLVSYGKGIDIEGKNAEQIAEMLEPLDLIVWKGHVVIVLDKDEVIESSPPQGVHKTSLKQRLSEILNERTPVNDWGSGSNKRFVVRRWIGIENP